MINIIVAYDQNRVIGKDNALIWHIPEDLKHFKKMTKGCVVIMGSNTWRSLGCKPLINRRNIVISSKYRSFVEKENCYDLRAPSINYALIWAKHWSDGKDIWVIGGATIYEQFLKLDLVDRIVATEIKSSYNGDTYFPTIDSNAWHETMERETNEFIIKHYNRIRVSSN